MMNGSNNSTVGVVDGPVIFSYFSLLSTLLYLLPVFIFNILLLAAIVAESTVPGNIRLLLGNIVVAAEVVICGLCITNLHNVIISVPQHLPPSSFICRLSYVVINMGAAGRLLYMATYAVSVYVTARFAGSRLREARIQFMPTLFAVAIIWVAACVPNTVLFSPVFVNINFEYSDDCVAHGNGISTLIYSFGYIIVYGVCSFAISIIFPILTIRYVKKNSIKENRKTLKGMIKFSVFLLIGNAINITGVSLPILFATFSPTGMGDLALISALNYLQGICHLVSLLPTPIILLIFFKPIRMRLKKMLSCVCLKSLGHKKSVTLRSVTSDSSF